MHSNQLSRELKVMERLSVSGKLHPGLPRIVHSIADQYHAVAAFTPIGVSLHYLVVNSGPLPPAVVAKYAVSLLRSDSDSRSD